MKTIVMVSSAQVAAAQCLVRIGGGLAQVDPLIAKIAEASPVTAEERKLLDGRQIVMVT